MAPTQPPHRAGQDTRMGPCTTRATLFSKPSLPASWSPLSKTLQMSLLSQHKFCEPISLLDLAPPAAADNTLSSISSHKTAHSSNLARRPLPGSLKQAYLTPLLRQGLLLGPGTELPAPAWRTDRREGQSGGAPVAAQHQRLCDLGQWPPWAPGHPAPPQL